MNRLKLICFTFSIFLFTFGFCFKTEAQSFHRHDMSIPMNSYRGKRPSSDSFSDHFAETQQRNLSVEKATIEQTDYSIIIIITFNIPINPNTISPETVSINDEQLDSSAVIKFNRVGNEVHISIPLSIIEIIDKDKTKNLFVHIDKIIAYDGAKLDKRTINNLEFNVTYK